jgi:ABC-type glycerol-3-phosphate transport system permease component
MRRRSIRAAYDVIGVMVFVVMLFPIYWMVSTAFKPGREILSLTPYWVPAPLTLDNFKTAIAQPYFWHDVDNSLTLVYTGVAISILLSSLTAGSGAIRLSGRTAFIVMVIAVQMVPLNALVILIYLPLDSVGQVDSLLGVIAYCYGGGSAVHDLDAPCAQHPRGPEEAAMVDGASRVGAFMRTCSRSSRPAWSPPRSSASSRRGTSTTCPRPAEQLLEADAHHLARLVHDAAWNRLGRADGRHAHRAARGRLLPAGAAADHRRTDSRAGRGSSAA